MKLGLIQLECLPGNVEQNLENASLRIQEAAEQGCSVCVLPELWLSGYDLIRVQSHSEFACKEAVPELRRLAIEFGLEICGGLPMPAENGGFSNAAVFIDPQSPQVQTYQKNHLFDFTPFNESDYFIAGDRRVSVLFGKSFLAGLMICFDLRFAEVALGYRAMNCSALCCIAQWPAARRMAWRTLLQARAIETQSFVFGCNAVGSLGDIILGGFSSVFAPDGTPLAEAGDSESLLVVDLPDPETAHELRRSLDVWPQSRQGIYQSL